MESSAEVLLQALENVEIAVQLDAPNPVNKEKKVENPLSHLQPPKGTNQESCIGI